MTYGIQTNNASGAEIFGGGISSSQAIVVGSVVVNANTTSSPISAEGLTASNTGEVLLTVMARGNEYATANYVTFTRGTGSFTISNSSSNQNFTMNYRVLRI